MENAAKIIVIDDEPGICKNVEKILAKKNYRVTRALSAREALEKMAKESFALMISDIVMPGMNGVELLKLVKKQWPLTKVMMMTAYASTDTALKSIRLGALDYLPKPFTPSELREKVEKALAGKLVEARISEAERDAIDVIDVDIPFEIDEVERQTGEAYARSLGPSDMPVVEVRPDSPPAGFCEVGQMVCDIFKKLGSTCKAGVKNAKCPRTAKRKAASKKGAKARDTRKLIGIDQPFEYDAVAAVTGPEYIRYMRSDGVVMPTYEQLKENVARLEKRAKIDVDSPFDTREVELVTGRQYARQVGRSDMPAVEITASESPEGFCQVGNQVCDIFKKLGATCKAGIKTSRCPRLAKKKKAAAAAGFDASRLIGPEMPFDYQEVAAVAGKAYLEHLRHDGTVQVYYEQLKADAERRARRRTEAPELVAIRGGAAGKRILVIDDEVAVNNNIRKILAKKGYGVDQAVTGRQALEKIDKYPYDLVILDLRIPGVKGLELLKAIVERRPEARVIMITGYASIETAVEAARMGVVGYLPKPFTPDEIRKATEQALSLAA